MYRITNVTRARRFRAKRRLVPGRQARTKKMWAFNGRRLTPKKSMLLSDDMFEAHKARLLADEAKGIIKVDYLSSGVVVETLEVKEAVPVVEEVITTEEDLVEVLDEVEEAAEEPEAEEAEEEAEDEEEEAEDEEEAEEAEEDEEETYSEEDLFAMTVKQLRALAEEEDIDLGDARIKKDIVAALMGSED